jgi:hypothetical protein
MAVTDSMRTWLPSHRSLRGERAPHYGAAVVEAATAPDRVVEIDAELAGQVVQRSAPSVANMTDGTWLPPLWLSW